MAEVASFILAAASLAGAIIYGQHYLRSAPKVPRAESGNVYRYEEHGDIVYVTAREHIFINLLFLSMFAGAGVSIAIEVYKKPFAKPRNGNIRPNLTE